MIRTATQADAPAIKALLRRQHTKLKNAAPVGICEKLLNDTVVGLISRQAQDGPQGSFCSIVRNEGFVMGLLAAELQPVNQFGDKLTAAEKLFVWEGGSAEDALDLFASLGTWARRNPLVVEVKLNGSRSMPGAGGAANLFRHDAFVKSGEIFEIRLDPSVHAEGIAA